MALTAWVKLWFTFNIPLTIQTKSDTINVMKRFFNLNLVIIIISFLCFGMGKPPQDPLVKPSSSNIIPSLDTRLRIDVIVKGMTCAICAQGIEKKLTENAAIQTIYVDFDRHLVSIVCHDKQAVSNTMITTAIEWAGYKVSSINRYEKN